MFTVTNTIILKVIRRNAVGAQLRYFV